MSDERCALVLEGGAMRGMYTAGVLDCFMDHDISFDAVIGVSAGALFGVNLLSKQRGRVIRYNKRFNSDKNYMGIRPLLREKNIVSTKYAYDIVPRELDPFDDEEYKKSDIPFYAVVTNIRTGKPEYVQIKSVFDQMDVLRASGSMPVVSKPVKLGNEWYLDGAVTDSIPYEHMLVTYAEKDGLTLCTVIMNAQSPDQYADTNTLLNYYFSNFKALSIAENENSAATDNTPDLGVMNEHGMYAKVSENYVVLPNNADFSSVKREAADMKSDNKDALATVRYKYGDHVVGCVDLLKSGAKVDLSYFDENSRQNVESDIIRIKPVYFLWVLVLIAVIILSIFMIRRISDNIYVLKHKWSIKKEQRERFREHKLERKQRRRRDNLKFSGRHKY